MTVGFGVSAQSCTYGAWLKVHVKCTGIFSFATNVDDSCVLKRALIPSHNITIDPRYSLDLTIKFLQHVFDAYTCTGASAITDAVTSTSMKSTMNTALDLPLGAPLTNRSSSSSTPSGPAEDLTDYATRDASNFATPRNTSWRWWRMEGTHSQVSQDVANANSVVRRALTTSRCVIHGGHHGPTKNSGSTKISTNSQLFQFRSQRVQSQCVLITSHQQRHSRPIIVQDSAVAVWPHPLRSGSMRQCGLALAPLVSVDVERTLFRRLQCWFERESGIHTCWNLGTNKLPTNSHGALRTQPSQVSLFWSTGGQGSPAIMNTLGRPSLCFSTCCLNVGRNHVAGAGHVVSLSGLFFFNILTAMPSLIHSCSLPWMRHPAQQ